MIRLSTSWMYQQSLTTMLNQQGVLSATQNQVSSGQRINLASDDPAGAAQVVSLNHVLASTAQYSANIGAANARLSTESSALDSFNALLDQARSMAVQGINGTLSASDRQDMATQLVQIRAQLVQLANSTDASGNALFAGTSTTTTPFVLNGDGSVSYAGNGGNQMTAIGSGLRIANSDAGAGLFMDIPAGNGSFVASAAAGNGGTLLVGATSVTDSSAWKAATAAGPVNYQISFDDAGNWTATDAGSGDAVAGGSYRDGGSISFNGMTIALSGTPAAGDTVNVGSGRTQDVFATLTHMIAALGDSSLDDTQLNNAMSRQMESIDRAQDRISSTQTDVGGRLNRLALQQSTYSDLTLTYRSTLSDVQDVDMASAISQLMLQSTALQASQQTFAKVQGMSLFDYLK
ncbi:flagellar hook-associated protein FlgL [Rhodanobacter sp. PCA2]|uniref:flagellar hook-associated protein FlgL n=1 Tax=Rhodanobacter sp. PCA2 TaxID=2006117 RepID=UPI001C62D2AE|nr:flagellar hook-associated protein FlgL [Rhodanobacter sp. PCA2]MBA2077186.1 flagellar hook-associated protein 3 [Rhodanobacter sp. PCA2]